MSIKKLYLSKQAMVKGKKNGLFAKEESAIDLYDYIAQVVNGGGSSAIITATNGLDISPANNVVLGGLLTNDTVVDGGGTFKLFLSNISTLEGDAVNLYLRGENTELSGTNVLFVKTPNVNGNTAVVGNILMLTDAATGECEWQPLTPNYTKGTITQITNATQDVTVNQPSGMITTFNETLAANGAISFTVNNTFSLVASQIHVNVNSYSGTYGTNGLPTINVSNILNGKFSITVINAHATNALNGVLKIAFLIV